MLLKIIISFHHGVDPVVQDLPNGPKGVVAQLARDVGCGYNGAWHTTHTSSDTVFVAGVPTIRR